MAARRRRSLDHGPKVTAGTLLPLRKPSEMLGVVPAAPPFDHDVDIITARAKTEEERV